MQEIAIEDWDLLGKWSEVFLHNFRAGHVDQNQIKKVTKKKTLEF